MWSFPKITKNIIIFSVCSFTFTKPGRTSVTQSIGHHRCEYFIRAPDDNTIGLNLTNFRGFGADGKEIPCMPKVEIREVIVRGTEHTLSTICHPQTNFQVPQVFQSDSHLVKLTFEWHSSAGFVLSYSFHKRESKFD